MKGQRRRLVGKVVSDKMMKTVVVEVASSYRHPLYGKVVHRSRRFKAHDEQSAKMGDTVRIVESRPISKDKRWVVEEIVNRGVHIELPDDEPLTRAGQPEGGAE